MKNKHNLQFTGLEDDLERWTCGRCLHSFLAETKVKAEKQGREIPCHDHREIKL